jgi:hypothetical protein
LASFASLKFNQEELTGTNYEDWTSDLACFRKALGGVGTGFPSAFTWWNNPLRVEVLMPLFMDGTESPTMGIVG